MYDRFDGVALTLGLIEYAVEHLRDAAKNVIDPVTDGVDRALVLLRELKELAGDVLQN